jgi:hypothetical protein
MNELYDKILEFGSRPGASLGGLVLGVVGIGMAVFFYVRSKRYRELKYYLSSRVLISEPEKKLEGLQVTYNSTPQKRVTVSRLSMWNAGTEVICPEDCPSQCPLLIRVPSDAEILDLSVVRTTNEASCFRLGTPTRVDENTVIPILFEYLDRTDAATTQIVHN